MKKILTVAVAAICLLTALPVYALDAIADGQLQTATIDDVAISNFGNGLTKSGAQWSASGGTATYTALSGKVGAYRLQVESSYTLFHSKNSFSVKGNRNYRVSFLYHTDFTIGADEVNVGLSFYDNDGRELTYKVTGLSGNSDGWQRFETTITTPAADCKAKFAVQIYGRDDKDLVTECYLSDLHITALPTEAVTDIKPGEAMIFGGSAKSSGMTITGVASSADGKTVTVGTSTVHYIFNKVENTVSGYQLSGKERKVVTVSLNKSLANLTTVSRSMEEVILTTGDEGVSFGVQMDGMMLIASHGDNLTATTTSAIDGKWNRLYLGNLIARDDIGGFTVNMAVPFGTGLLPEYTASEGVDFENVFRDTSFISKAKVGWNVTWEVCKGEMLAVSVFPPKEYDWQFSLYDTSYRNFSYDSAVSGYATLHSKQGMKSAVLYDFSNRAWGMSFSDRYEMLYETEFQAHIDAAKSAGVKAAEYMSFYFWHNRDVDEYIAEVKRHRDTYGIEGVYIDGLPDMEWLASYDCIRRLRELFPDGTIIIHTTGQSLNGGPPLACPDIYIPAIDAYGSMTLRGEDTDIYGTKSPYLRYVTSGYGSCNTPGIIKGNRWVTDEESKTKISDADADLIHLLYNGRARIGSNAEFASADYENIMNRIRQCYQNYSGRKEDFYRLEYQPLVHNLVREKLKNNPPVTVYQTDFTESNVLNNWNLTKDPGTDVKIISGRMELSDTDIGSCSAEYLFEEENGLLTVSYDAIPDDSLPLIWELKDKDGNPLCSMMFFDQKLWVMDKQGGYRKVSAIGSNNSITVAADISDGSIILTVNGNVCLRDEPMLHDSKNASSICFRTHQNAKGRCYIDNLVMKSQI